MKELEARLNALCSRNGKVKRAALALLKDYIRQYGGIDWSDEPFKIETTFYGNGYYTAEIEKVWIDEEEDELVIDTNLGEVREFDGDYTNDTILDILCAVIGNESVAK